jgi:GTPase
MGPKTKNHKISRNPCRQDRRQKIDTKISKITSAMGKAILLIVGVDEKGKIEILKAEKVEETFQENSELDNIKIRKERSYIG